MSTNNFNEIKIFDDAVDNMDIIKTIIDTENQENGFYIVDIGDVINKHREWITKIPRVVPHYGISICIACYALSILFFSLEEGLDLNFEIFKQISNQTPS